MGSCSTVNRDVLFNGFYFSEEIHYADVAPDDANVTAAVTAT